MRARALGWLLAIILHWGKITRPEVRGNARGGLGCCGVGGLFAKPHKGRFAIGEVAALRAQQSTEAALRGFHGARRVAQ